MTTCQSCGSPLETGSTYCRVCAAEVPSTSGGRGGGLAPDVVLTRETTPPEDSFDYLSRTGSLIQPAISPDDAAVIAAGGEPSPAMLGVEVAPVGRRIAALVIDGLCSGLLYGAFATLAVVTENLVLVLVGAMLAGALGLVQWFLEGQTGSTIGARVLGVQVVRVWSFEPPGLLAALVRTLLVGLGSIGLGIGSLVVAISGLFDAGPWQRGWHDRAAKVVVIRRRPGSAVEPARSLDELLAPPAGATQSAVAPPPAPSGRRAAPPAPPSAPPAPGSSGWEAPDPVGPPQPAVLISSVPGFGPPAEDSEAPAAAVPAASTTTAAPVAAPPAPAAAPTLSPPPAAAPPPPPPPPPLAAVVELAPEPQAVVPVAAPAPAMAEAPLAVPAPAVPAVPVTAPAPASHVEAVEAVAAPAASASTVATSDEPITAVEAVESYVAQDLDDLEHTRISARAQTGPVLVLPGGERLTVRGSGVLGRNPSATDGEQAVHLVRVQDRTRTVSKSHLAFGSDSVGLWVRDLASTNGTAVRSADGALTELEPYVVVHVLPGDTLVVGDDAEVMVE